MTRSQNAIRHPQDGHAHTSDRGRHTRDHDHAQDLRKASRRSLIAVLVMLCIHMTIEVIGGMLSGSLGLLAHAAHMTTDAVAVGLALFAMWDC